MTPSATRILLFALLSAFCVAPADAVVRIESLTGTAMGQGAAAIAVGELTCGITDTDSATSIWKSKSCLQDLGRRTCRVFDVYGGFVVYQPMSPDPTLVLDVSKFEISNQALARTNPGGCENVTSVDLSASASFSVSFEIDAPTEVTVSGSVHGGTLTTSLPGVSFPSDSSIETTLVVQPPGFSLSGSAVATASGTTPDEVFERVEIWVSFSTPKPRVPVVLIPGIGGTYAADIEHDGPWLFHRGAHPADTRVDPLAGAYDDLIQTLHNVGYEDGKDLFVVNYDWRLPPGPSDGVFDGVISGLSGASISDDTFEYAVDYLGWVLLWAAEAWQQNHPGETLDAVDVIAHSTGGLVARTYLQSAAFRDQSGLVSLPGVRNLFLIGVPNRGASKAWNPLHDNWGADAAYVAVLSKILNRVYQKVKSPAAAIVAGPVPISLNEILDPATNEPDPLRFIQRYVPTIRALLATYPFLDLGAGLVDVNDDPAVRNDLLLDLNDGFDLTGTTDPIPFVDRAATTVIYGTNVSTPTVAQQWLGPIGDAATIAPFTDFVKRKPALGEVWYRDVLSGLAGDGTVPIDSSAGLFFGDSRVTLEPFTKGANTSDDVSHLALMWNPDVQALLLERMGVPFGAEDISTNLHYSLAASLWASNDIVTLGALVAVLDPVEGVLVDGAGRRLGYTESAGAFAEIPGSRWIGGTDGFGFVLGPSTGPFSFVLTGLGGPHYAGASVFSGGGSGGVVDTAPLGIGEVRVLPVPIPEPAAPLASVAAAATLTALRRARPRSRKAR